MEITFDHQGNFFFLPENWNIFTLNIEILTIFLPEPNILTL